MSKIISLIVKTNANKNKIISLKNDRLEVWVKAKPEQNQANQAVIENLALYFNVNKSKLKIISGHHGPRKRIQLIDPKISSS